MEIAMKSKEIFKDMKTKHKVEDEKTKTDKAEIKDVEKKIAKKPTFKTNPSIDSNDENKTSSERPKPQKIIQKPDHFFNRIHVDDLCEILYHSIRSPDPGEIFNVSDYTPSTSEEFINEATKLLNMPKAKIVNIRDADLSDLALSFYADSKKVSNKKIVKKLKYKFKYPSYKEGLKSLIKN